MKNRTFPALLLTLLSLVLLLFAAADRVASDTPEPDYRVYLPLLLRPAAVQATFTAPQNWGLASQGADLAEAAQATDVTVRRNEFSMFAWNTGASPPWSPQYTLTRGFVAFDLTGAPPGFITGAALELYPWAVSGPVAIEIRRGTWTGTPTATDWNAYGELLVTVFVTDTLTGPLWVPLALEEMPVPTTLYLVLRGDEVTPLGMYQSLGAAFGFRSPDDMPDMPVSKLHLWLTP